MPGKLRIFLYRDDALVSQFLEQLEGGTYDEETIRRRKGSGGSLGVGIGAGPVGLKGSLDKSASQDLELNLRQTGPSRFSRFFDLASGSDDVQPLDAIDDGIWNQLEPGEIIDAAVVLEVPAFLKSIDIARKASSLLPLFEAVATIRGAGGKPVIDPAELRTVKRQLPVAEDVATVTEAAPLPVLGSLASSPRYKFFLRLRRADILADELGDLDGPARLIGAIQSKVARGKSTVVGQLMPGLPPSNRAARRRSATPGGAEITLRYPAAVITPIGIFR